MHIIQQIVFLIITSISVFLVIKRIKDIRRNIFLGTKKIIFANANERFKNVAMLAFGQKKMFKNMPVAILHLFVYVGFIIINIEIIEIILDGVLGTHRLFAKALGGFYTFLISSFEILAVLVLIAVVIFYIRRNILKVKRLAMPELDGFPKKDANIILYFEIILMSLFLIMNALDINLQNLGNEHYTHTGSFLVSTHIANLFTGLSQSSLLILERSCWWMHIIGIFIFMNYLAISKHLHIILAFPNSYYNAPLSSESIGKMQNMSAVQNEVLYMMEPEKAPTEAAAITKFGAKDIFDLEWTNLMSAYSCTECGRCTSACPANQTGKILSPRKIMMDTRDRLEEVGKNINENTEWKDDGKTLINNYISVEELRACTTCNACVEACPVSISPLNIIIELRRSLIMEDSNAPQEWNQMFGNIENNMAPWKFSPDDRDAWVNN